MKKMMILILILMMIAPVAHAELYPMTARVYMVDEFTDTVTVETFMGFLFSFEGVEDWAEGDCCALIMDDCGTAGISDDLIVSARYSGWDLVNWME